VRNRRRVVYYAILLLLILGELLGERNYIIIIFPEYDRNGVMYYVGEEYYLVIVETPKEDFSRE